MATAPSSETHSDPRLSIPPPPVHFLPRPRVVAALERAAAKPIILVTGPAGAGKTTAVASWVRDGPRPGRVAWLSMSPTDADPADFAAALRRAAGLHPGPAPELRTGLVAGLGRGGVLVLDDILTGEHAPALLDELLRWPPDGVHVVVISRNGPPPALRQHRLAGRLGVLGSAELAFTPAELEQLLRQEGIPHTEAAASRLLDLTEGWPGPLLLATQEAGSHRTVDPDLVAAHLADPGSLIAGYLHHEVLAPLPEADRELLTRTSIVAELDPALARTLADRDVSEAFTDLADRELLVPAATAGRLRQRPLVARMLAARLQADRPALDRRLRRIAMVRQEEGNEPLAALTRAIEDEDWVFAGELALRSSAPAILLADRGQLARLLERVPPEQAFGSPELEIGRAIVAFTRRDALAVRTLLSRAEPELATLPEPRRSIATLAARVLLASQAYREGDAALMVRSAEDADRLLSGLSAADAPVWAHNRGIPRSLLAVGEVWVGHPTRSLELLPASIVGYPSTEMAGYVKTYYTAQLAVAEAGAGLFTRARASAEMCIAAAEGAGDGLGHETQGAWLALAMAAIARADPAAARDAIGRGRAAAGPQLHPLIGASFHLVNAWASLQQGDLPGARRQLRSADAAVLRQPGMTAVAHAAVATRIVLDLAAGSPVTAEAAARTPTETAPTDLLRMARAEAAQAGGRPDQVHDLVAPLLDRSDAYGAAAWLAEALALDAQRQDFRAADALTRALDLAAPEDLLLPFLRPSHRLRTALSRHLAVVGSHRELVERVLAATDAAGEQPRTYERLTERELSVLAHLPTMQSNAEIAAALSISENTVKQHLKVVYRKLGVRNRRDAVRVAGTLGLLPG